MKHGIKHSLSVVPILLFLGLIQACSSESPALPELEMVNGDRVSVSEYQGQHVLINYWAVWCKPCIEEIPELNALAERDAITVLGYNFDRSEGDVLQEQVNKLGIGFELLKGDPAPQFKQKTPSALPATMLISPEGKFIKWLMGPQTEAGLLGTLGS